MYDVCICKHACDDTYVEVRGQLCVVSSFMWVPGTELMSPGLHGKCSYHLSHLANPSFIPLEKCKHDPDCDEVDMLKLLSSIFGYLYSLI